MPVGIDGDSVEAEITRLRDLDLRGLRARWRGLFRKEAPAHLPRHLLFGIIAYQLQADVYGDLDAAAKKAVDGLNVEAAGGLAGRLATLDRQREAAETGTTLVREWKGRQHRVMAVVDGFAWNGTTYKSLSQVAFAITGTKWNGPRFFGLRDALPVTERREAGQ